MICAANNNTREYNELQLHPLSACARGFGLGCAYMHAGNQVQVNASATDKTRRAFVITRG